MSRRHDGIDLIKVHVDRSFADQGPFDVFVHDFTHVARGARDGDRRAELFLAEVKDYISRHPHMVVMNPLASWALLYDRLGAQKVAIEVVRLLNDSDVIVPNRAYLDTSGVENVMKTLEASGVTFPFDDLPNIQFSTPEVARFNSVSPLNAGKHGEPTSQTRPVSAEKMSRISEMTRRVLGSSLVGIDVIVQDGTGKHVIIDMNDFPGYHEVGVREFQMALLQRFKTSCFGS
ncbi:ITPK1 [Branchiostoma lanceolatum]|uniref:ITPK1 protein n=1 Tax=Branchiostoma lanceolatum TaxID=7740 RepID=A0A8J9Z4R8_BRALA|nr:ITPK1 [Branchiostoma lanceolatum]